MAAVEIRNQTFEHAEIINMRKRVILSSMAAYCALAACSGPAAPAHDTDAPVEAHSDSPSHNTDSTNLSPEQAIALLKNRDELFREQYERVLLRYRRSPEDIQWLIDKGFAEGTTDNWSGANGAMVDPNPYSSIISIPTHHKVLAIDGITTEGKRATIRYRFDFTPNEPAYTAVCVEAVHALIPNQTCDKRSMTHTTQAMRQDDGQWL